MELDPLIGSISTVVAFTTFVGIVAWAYAGQRRSRFARAAAEPFALPDETEDRSERPR